MKGFIQSALGGVPVVVAAHLWFAVAPAAHGQAISDLHTISVLPTGTYEFSSTGQTFDGYVHNDGTHSWLLVGRGRNGWEFDADGQGAVDDVGDAALLGTVAAFPPAMYSEAIIQDLISASGVDLTGVEIRIRRAANVSGTAYSEARWRPISQTTWRSNFDADTSFAVELEIVDGGGVPGANVGVNPGANTRDSEIGGNDGDRVFTWGWNGHGSQKGFSYGSAVAGVDGNNPDTFLWEFGTENHAIPYAELYIRLEAPSPVTLPDTDGDGIFDLIEMSMVGNLDDLGAGDDDGDGLSSPDEVNIHRTNPLVVDTDGDGLGDGEELAVYHLSGPLDALQAESNGGFGAVDAGVPGAGDGFGFLTGSFDTRTDQLSYTISWGGLTSSVTNMHFHRGAPQVSGGVEVGIPGPWASPQSGSGIAVSQAQSQNLLAGEWYVNVHTGTFGGGEIRGQVIIQQTSPLSSDSDGDGLSDGEELNVRGTNPMRSDSDGDGDSDAAELELGSDPTDGGDFNPPGTVVLVGEVGEFAGPDDLHLDPASAVIAVDVYGDMDREVNGVVFRTDGRTAGGGSARERGVTLTTTAANQIDNWAGAPVFTGLDAPSVANLAEIMRDIRWMNAPSPVQVDLSGLYPGGLYEIQLLTNEGGDRNRRWDIAVGDQLVVDDYSSEGSTADPVAIWTPNNSAYYRGEFAAPADGMLTIRMQQQFGGRPWPGGDGNPILQAVVVHLDRTDDDGDGLPNWYEVENGLDPNVADPDDLDGDGSPNAEEFDNGTDPDESDTDGDGLSDGDEASAGADPNNPDTDGDGLTDGDEVNTIGTSPILSDTDNDQVSDAVELAEGSDPLDAASRPTAIEDLSWISVLPTASYKILAGGVIFNGYVHNDGTHSWLLIGRGRNGWEFDADGQGTLEEVGDASLLGTVDAFPPAMYNDGIIQSLISNAGADVTGVEIRMRRAATVDGSRYSEARWRPLDQLTWRSNFDLDTNFLVELEVVDTGGVPGAALGVNPAANTRDSQVSGNGGDRVFTWAWNGHANQKGFSYGQVVPGVDGNDPNTFLWEAGTENHAIPYTELYIRLEDPGVVTLPDSDGDGIFDLVETGLVGNLDDLTAGDDDGDGLTSPEEVNTVGTNPLSADSDGDGLNDGDEVNVHGTNPLLADTDGDGLSDGEEIGTHGTDPNLADTDGDGLDDKLEILVGADPQNPNDPSFFASFPFDDNDGGFTEMSSGNTPIPAIYDSFRGTWLFDGDDAGPATNLLDSPDITMPATGGVRIFFAHRYSIEPEWDGVAIQFSRNGGPFVTVPPHRFIQNGYTFSGLIGNHVLNGGDGFNGDSPGYAEDRFIVSAADLPGVASGDRFQVRFVGAWDESVRGGGVPNWEVTNVSFGLSPDQDGDGLPDHYEDANGLDKTLASDAADDPDGDGLSNLGEFLNGTDLNDPDSDADGLTDQEEVATHGTDPLSADTDADGLTDAEEVNVHGTDPTLSDTDGDGAPDGLELLVGRDPKVADPPGPARRYVQNFDVFPDGTMDLADNSTIGSTNNQSAAVVGGRLRLTEDGVGSTRSSFRIPALLGSSQGFSASFDFTITDGPGANEPADGFNFSYGAIPPLTANDASPNGHGAAEEAWPGVNHLSFEIDTWQNIDAEVGVNIASEIDTVSTDHAFTNGSILADGTTVSGTATISWDPENGASFTTTGLVTNADFQNIPIPGFTGNDDYIFAFGARTGGATQTVFIDNLVITTGGQPLRLAVSGSGDDLVLTWDSRAGRVYDIVTSPDLATEISGWEILMADIPTTAPVNVEMFARPADETRFYAVVEREAPPLFSDDFESDNGWVVGSDPASPAGTAWERGIPGPAGGFPPTSGAGGSLNCFATNISGDYGPNVDIFLRSPVIDLTGPGITGATLEFAQYRDTDQIGDFGFVRVLRASDDSPLGADIARDIGGFDTDWTSFTGDLPPEAVGEMIRLEFQFTSDASQEFSGWYLDDVAVKLK